MISLTHRTKKNVCVVYITGQLTAETSNELVQYLKPILLEPHLLGVVLDLEKAPYMDSFGVSVVLGLFNQLQKKQMLDCVLKIGRWIDLQNVASLQKFFEFLMLV